MRTLSQDKFRKAAKRALVDRDLSVTALARKLGVSRNAVSIAIHHPTMFPRVRKAVAQELELEVAL